MVIYCDHAELNHLFESDSLGGAYGQPGGGGRGVLPYLTRRYVPLNRVSFCGKNYATGCPFLTKIMRQGITIDKNIMRQGIMWKDTL